MALNPTKLSNLILLLGQSPLVENLGTTKLWKLIYFIDTKHLREFGVSLTGSEYIKYEHGPVPSRGERVLKKLSKSGTINVKSVDYGSYRQNHISTAKEAIAPFSEDELTVIESVCIELGRETATNLSEISHLEPAWINADQKQKLSGVLMHYGSSEDEEGL